MELPRALAPWSSYLELFPRELAVALAPLVQRLDRAVGPLQAAGQDGSGEPEGFSGIAPRGTYDRLLLSEWLLADEAPEEFARRAAMSEQAFFQLARREPSGARVSVALFDAGPSQWGGPRIAHLATLVVLARRAAAAGAQFLWGVAQRPGDDFETEVNAASVQRLLAARTHQEVLPADLDTWRRRIEEFVPAGPPTDWWMVGGRRAAHLSPREAAVLRVEEILEPEARELEAVTRDGDRTRRVTLPLPDDPTCTRLLRDPFAAATAAPVRAGRRLAPQSNLVFGAGATKLLARGPNNSLIAYPVPNSPRAAAGRPRVYQPRSGNPIVAAGRLYRSILAVTAATPGGVMRLECIGGKGFRAAHWETSLSVENTGGAPPSEAPLGQCFPIRAASTSAAGVSSMQEELLVQVGRNLALVRSQSDPRRRARSLIETVGVAAVAPHNSGFVYVQGSMLFAIGPDGVRQHMSFGEQPRGGRAFFGWGGHLTNPVFGLAAAEQEDGTWHVLSRNGVQVFAAPSGTRMEGILAHPEREAIGLVLLEADRRSLSVMGNGFNLRLPRTQSEIEHVTVSPCAPLIAYATVDGEVLVYSVQHEALIYRFLPEAER